MINLRKSILIALAFAPMVSCFAEDVQNVKPVKNVIVLIPDGCSIATVSTARWYQWYTNPTKEHLALDKYLCGTVRTSCSNAPIGDSAPTTSCYMTGYMSRAGWVSTYPTVDPENDIYPLDKSKEYQPLTTVLEAAKLVGGKATGLVSTCEFPHATPADCSSHSYDRNKFEWISSQQVHNNIDVLLGGGVNHLSKECENYLTSNGWGVIKNDIAGMRNYDGNRMWALFHGGSMPYDMDRDKMQTPSLAEMTSVALNKLSKSKNGFFLMVEGSEVDFAAHNNDPAAMITEFLAFDEACRVAFEFAEKDGNTAVVVAPDHGNSGLSIGRRDWGGYSTTSKKSTFDAITRMHASCEEMARKVNSAPFDSVQSIFRQWCGFELRDIEMEALKNNREYRNSPIPRNERKRVEGTSYNSGLARMIAQFMTDRTGLAFTTNGHTGEEVFLAAYHPTRDCRPYGMLTNVELNHYLCSLYGMTHETLDSLTSANFAPHHEVLKGMKYEIVDKQIAEGKTQQQLVVKLKDSELVIAPNTNQVVKRVTNGKVQKEESITIPSVTVYVDRNKTFYIPRSLKDIK
ncbi:MAG: alkaline phosphatase [Bacteroidaceae bacterium]|nr:alkaline phosphatase [Bacteroidaceae bacterium]